MTEETLALPFTADLSVGQVARAELLRCAPQTTVRAAAQLMSANRCSSILVMEQDVALGIWTEHDALRLDFADAASFERPIADVMSRPVRTLAYDTPLREVADAFRREHLRHFLVLDAAGAPMGLLSQGDVVRNQGIEHFLRLRTVGSVVRSTVPIVAAEADIGVARDAMRAHASDAALVAYADGEHGILTERDLVRLVAGGTCTLSAGEASSRPLLMVDESETLYAVRTLLVDKGVRHVGVRRADQHLLGLVSFNEILSGIEVSYIRELQSALRERDRALSSSQRSLHLAEKIIESSLEGLMITDPNVIIRRVNPAFTRVTGYRPEEVVGKSPAVLSSGRHDGEFYRTMWAHLQEHGHWQGEIWNRRKNGEIYPQSISITAIRDAEGRISHYAALFNDITKLKRDEERIRHLAYYDPLTGLPNRRLLADRLQMAIAHAHRHGLQVAVLFIDLDRFKQVNDSLGHAAGDRLLETLAQRLRECVREDDTVARIAGDEFVIVLCDLEEPASALRAAERVTRALREPVQLPSGEVIVTASVGLALYPENGASASALLDHADTAMYRAKAGGRDRLSTYAPEMSAEARYRLRLETDLRRALERGELELHYQPLVTPDGTPVSAEALLRWRHPERGLVPPGEFIELAEETGLIEAIGSWVLEEAARQLALWEAAGYYLPSLAVNVSGRQLHRPGFAEQVRAVLQRAGLAPGRLVLELTESMLLDGAGASELAHLKALGVGLALDDFGTGYCALNYLKTFPIDRLKIDRSFIADMDTGRHAAVIVSTLIELAQSLELLVVAEGVENEQQRAALAARGCDLLQGFLFSPALPAAQFAQRFLRTRAAETGISAY